MIAYHGTSLQAWLSIQTEGIRPRGEGPKSNWDHSIESNPDTVYLTDSYAMLFGLNALKLSKEGTMNKVVIIELETDDLPGTLVADEDALEQVSRHCGDGLPKSWDMVRRTRHYRGMVHTYAENGFGFNWSMGILGTGGHVGAIPPSHFTRVAIVDIAKAHALTYAYMDTSPSAMAYRVMGGYLRAMARGVFGDSTEYCEDEFIKLPPLSSGIEVINLGGITE